MLYIIRADNEYEHYLTDMVTRRYLTEDGLKRQQYLASLSPDRYFNAGKAVVWPKAAVDEIPLAG